MPISRNRKQSGRDFRRHPGFVQSLIYKVACKFIDTKEQQKADKVKELWAQHHEGKITSSQFWRERNKIWPQETVVRVMTKHMRSRERRKLDIGV